MSKAKLIILLLLSSCIDEDLVKAKYEQGYFDGNKSCVENYQSTNFELWEGSGVYNKYTNIDARKALEDCSGNKLLELETHRDVEQYLHLCKNHEILRKEFK